MKLLFYFNTAVGFVLVNILSLLYLILSNKKKKKTQFLLMLHSCGVWNFFFFFHEQSLSVNSDMPLFLKAHEHVKTVT